MTLKKHKPLCEANIFLKNIHWKKNQNKYLLILDFDGTLSNLVEKAEDATLPPETLRDLQRLEENPSFNIIIVSGRPLNFLEKQFGSNFNLAGEYGLDSNFSTIQSRQDTSNSYLEQKSLDYFKELVLKHKGSYIEQKKFSYVWHYRPVKETLSKALILRYLQELNNILETSSLEAQQYNNVLEVKLKKASKKAFLEHFLKEKQEEYFIIAAGDDISDEELFTVIPKDQGVSIAVGDIINHADYTIPSPQDFRNWLQDLVGITS